MLLIIFPLGVLLILAGVAMMATSPLKRNKMACLDCKYTWRYPSKVAPRPPVEHSGQGQKPQGKRSRWLLVAVVPFLLFLLLAGLGFIREKQLNAELARADALWSESKQADAANIYMAELERVDDALRPEIFKRIITQLSDNGDKDKATEYCNLALAEGLDIKFGYSDLDRLFDGARQVIVERDEKALAEKQAEEQRIAQEKLAADWAEKQAEVQQAAAEKEANRGNVEATKQFYETVKAVGYQGVIADLYSHKDGPPWQLTITVNAGWDALPQSTRTEYAKTFRGAWAGVCPVEPGGARISFDIVNLAGKKVGGGSTSQESYWAD